jgi:hypothetical protein
MVARIQNKQYLGDMVRDGAVVKLGPAAGSEDVVVDAVGSAWQE